MSGAPFFNMRRIVFPTIRAAVGNPELHRDLAGCWDVDFPERLRSAVEQRGGFEKISDLTGLPIPQLKSYCHGGRFPSLWNAGLIALACDVSLDWLMDMKAHRRRGGFFRKLQRLSAAVRTATKLREETWTGIGLIAVIALVWGSIIIGAMVH
jgi:hypothetical protein